MTRSHRVRAAGVLLALAATATGCGGGSGPAAAPAAPAGAAGAGTSATAAVLPVADRQPAPDTAGTGLDGDDLALRGYRGQVVVLNVWGSWCAPCRAEARELEALRAATAARGVRVLGVNVRDRSTGPARQFEKTYGLHYPSIHDPAGALLLAFPPALLNPQAIPSTLVIDRRGRIAAAVAGPVTRAGLAPLVAAVAGEPA
ncbi:TlpA disulfide reductase family protein [Streptomyces sp. NPDC089919]|uniref:TlpA family protein disulfide reductase n=1 Tax=Streptomyces sp. NPDC089919 TaxID=3155188 RepID=UPI0034436AC2